MKLIMAVIRPHLLDRLVVAFEDIEGFPGITVVSSEGFGQRINSEPDTLSPLKPNKRIEIAAPDDLTDTIVAVIRQYAHTGRKGDGIILVLPIEQSVLI